MHRASPGRKVGTPEVGYGAAFDRLFARGRAALLAGTNHCDSPPVDGGRWGLSVVLPPDPACAARLAVELGEDAWFEADFARDIWYATLVHFTAPLRDPVALVDWVAARRGADLGDAVVNAAELLRFRFNGRQPVRVPLASAPFGAGTG